MVAMEQNSDTPLQDAVAALLRRVPERWAEYDADALTATESQALFLLVAAGMVERRIRLRARLHNHPVAVEATITATGEYGLVEAIQSVIAGMWADWEDAFRDWRNGEAGTEPAFIAEHLKPDEWRLTNQGHLARTDLDGENMRAALDFVLRRGFFDGQPRLILAPGECRIAGCRPVPGYGRLVTMRKVQADAVPPPAVSIGNWKEGADAFAVALESTVKTALEAKAKSASKGDLPASGWLGAAELASMYEVDAEKLRKRLDRFRKRSAVGWTENPAAGRGDARYLFDSEAVRSIIDELRRDD